MVLSINNILLFGGVNVQVFDEDAKKINEIFKINKTRKNDFQTKPPKINHHLAFSQLGSVAHNICTIIKIQKQ